ncbi:right-handed parallel beta-helix repeat-containing protein [Echinicola sp. 20G]|uniref:alpha-1,3-galactosidase-related protein n=1 Tax=Echinicola sp. 20G TaxID=2781961 RepID=UPI001910BFCA|nr:right-handed parallel beta-helix repeat-containing protein [Echinicola sp. 20G]
MKLKKSIVPEKLEWSKIVYKPWGNGLAILMVLILGCAFSVSGRTFDGAPARAERKLSKGETTYYVDLVNGNDRNSGTKKNEAWKSFTPANNLILRSGDTLKVIQPGRIDKSLALIAEGECTNPVVVEFIPGKYNFFPENALQRKLNISNTNDTPDLPKSIAFEIVQSQHVEVFAEGAEIMFRGKSMAFHIDRSNCINIKGLSMDYERPTVSEITVAYAGKNHADLDVGEDSDFVVKDGKVIWTGEGWQHPLQNYWQEYDPIENKVRRLAVDVGSTTFEKLGNRVLRAHFPKNPGFVQGMVLQNRNVTRDYAAVFMNRSNNISWQQIRVYFMHGMGFVSQFCKNVTVDGLDVRPRPGSGRTCAAWADILHFSSCRGDLKVKNSYLSAANDDAINVHGTHLKIQKILNAHRITVSFEHPQTYGFDAFEKGDSIAFINEKTLLENDSNVVTGVKKLNDKVVILELLKPVSEYLTDGYVVENTSWTPNVEISRNKITCIPTRGVLVTTRKQVRILENEFSNIQMSAVLIADDAQSWFESGMVKDVEISKNSFMECGGPVINIHPENEKSVDGRNVHQNIKIMNNTFYYDENALIHANSVGGLSFSENRIITTEKKEISSLMFIENCPAPLISGNTFSVVPLFNQSGQ